MLEAQGLWKRFGALQAARDVSFRLPGGARHALIGPNGAGKTTLFNLLAGEIRPDAGRILLDGRDVTRASPDARARAGLGRSFQRQAVSDKSGGDQGVFRQCRRCHFHIPYESLSPLCHGSHCAQLFLRHLHRRHRQSSPIGG